MAKTPELALAASLRKQDALLGGLISGNPMAIAVVGANDGVQMVNAAFEALFGYREAELVGKQARALMVPEELAHESSVLTDDGLHGRPARVATRRRRKDRSLVEVEVMVVPIVRARDEPAGAYIIYRDLSEQRYAERHLRAQYAVIEALAHSSTIEQAAPWVLRSVAESVGWPVGAMWIVDKTADCLRCVDFWSDAAVNATAFETATRASHFKRGIGPGRTWEQGAPAWIVDVTAEAKFSRRETALAAGLHAAFSFPMLLDGDVVGVVEFFSSTVLEPDAGILKMFAALGQQLGEFVGRTRAQEQLERFFSRRRRHRRSPTANRSAAATRRLISISRATRPARSPRRRRTSR